MNKQEIKNKIKQLESETQKLKDSWRNDKDYVKFSTLAYKAKIQSLEITKPLILKIDQEIEELKKQLLSTKKHGIVLSTTMEEFVKSLHCGVNYGPKGLIPVETWENRFILLKQPGHITWAALGSTRYAKTQYSLHDITLLKDNNSTHGMNIFTSTCLFDCENLNTKQAIQKAENHIKSI